MPFIRVDTVAGRYGAKERTAMSDVLYEAVLGIGALENDRFQVFTEHPPSQLVFDPTYLDIRRTDGFVVVQITMNAGRSLDQKKQLCAAIADGFQSRIGIRREDVFINLIEVPRENWSFGNGVAQYAPHS
jgi:phenylpyruvate tautomerase PptA (4-oxalocrotonate tautomerase family)